MSSRNTNTREPLAEPSRPSQPTRLATHTHMIALRLYFVSWHSAHVLRRVNHARICLREQPPSRAPPHFSAVSALSLPCAATVRGQAWRTQRARTSAIQLLSSPVSRKVLPSTAVHRTRLDPVPCCSLLCRSHMRATTKKDWKKCFFTEITRIYWFGKDLRKYTAVSLLFSETAISLNGGAKAITLSLIKKRHR